ncbi:mitotic fidelity of chromosome transmission- protein [Dimargaris verticillata]|uniref:Mitotic fidelity of chromosome transmission-protein n=1 Tax=Dimargaris verticillata TaxID=2761393 RepID=A0A9W8ECZ6_9FUNG|nr:mitotic fidelity of chromosome transmission- protein [Dimargaris verticillata]
MPPKNHKPARARPHAVPGDIGVRGRKTGLQIGPAVTKDADGFDDIDAFFSDVTQAPQPEAKLQPAPVKPPNLTSTPDGPTTTIAVTMSPPQSPVRNNSAQKGHAKAPNTPQPTATPTKSKANPIAGSSRAFTFNKPKTARALQPTEPPSATVASQLLEEPTLANPTSPVDELGVSSSMALDSMQQLTSARMKIDFSEAVSARRSPLARVTSLSSSRSSTGQASPTKFNSSHSPTRQAHTQPLPLDASSVVPQRAALAGKRSFKPTTTRRVTHAPRAVFNFSDLNTASSPPSQPEDLVLTTENNAPTPVSQPQSPITPLPNSNRAQRNASASVPSARGSVASPIALINPTHHHDEELFNASAQRMNNPFANFCSSPTPASPEAFPMSAAGFDDGGDDAGDNILENDTINDRGRSPSMQLMASNGSSPGRASHSPTALMAPENAPARSAVRRHSAKLTASLQRRQAPSPAGERKPSKRPRKSAAAVAVSQPIPDSVKHSNQPEPAEALEAEHGIRRSRRMKLKPLAYWKNERVVYTLKHEGQQAVPAVREVIRDEMAVPPVEPAPSRPNKSAAGRRSANFASSSRAESSSTGAKQRGRKRKPPASPEADMVEPLGADTLHAEAHLGHLDEDYGDGASFADESMVSPCASEANTLAESEAQEPIVAEVLDYETEEPIHKVIGLSAKMVKLKPVLSAGCYFQKCLQEAEWFSSGVLVINPEREKLMRQTTDAAMIFYIVSGRCSVTVAGTTFTMSRGDQFLVPRGNEYRVVNTSRHDAKLFFTRATHTFPEPSEPS